MSESKGTMFFSIIFDLWADIGKDLEELPFPHLLCDEEGEVISLDIALNGLKRAEF